MVSTPHDDSPLNDFLVQFNSELLELEGRLISGAPKDRHPPVFIVGLQRSGTTLLSQLLLRHFDLFYPNNMLARFYETPTVGTLLTKTLESYLQVSDDMDSELGRTSEMAGLHEFGFFWKRFFPTGVRVERKTIEEDSEGRFARLRATLHAISGYAGKPLIFKNLVQLALNTDGLRKLFPEALFIEVTRDPFFVAQSTLLSRERLHGDLKGWFGIVPPGVKSVADSSPVYQVAWQVRTSSTMIDQQRASAVAGSWIRISYENLAAKPEKELARLENFLMKNMSLKKNGSLGQLKPFASRNIHRLDKAMRRELEECLL